MNSFATRITMILATTAAACVGNADPASEDVRSATSAIGIYDWTATASQGLRIGSWNTKRMGQGEKRYDLMAQVINTQFDVVGLEEIMDANALAPLMALLPGWSSRVSERSVGRNGYNEWYAVLYRTASTTVTSSYVVPDTADEFAREPMVTCLRTGRADYCLVSTHIVFGDLVGPRDLEIQALGRLTAQLRAAGREKDWIVLGDFNRSATAGGFSTLYQNGFEPNDDMTVRTTLGTTSYSNPYDHALMDRSYTREWTGVSGRYDTVANVCGGSFAFCAQYVSDHAPIGILYNATLADDD